MTTQRVLPTGARWRWLALVLVVGSTAAFPASLVAQQSEGPAPLSKADVIRLLTSDTYSESQVERIVRRSCLSFRLTDRDRADFRDLGASPSILAALTDCSQSASLTVTAIPGSLRATVGDTVPVTLVARRGDAPAEGIPLSVPEAIGARGDASPVVNTNARGQAHFRVAAGREPTRRSLEVTSPGSRMDAELAIPFVVQPAGPAALREWPDSLNVRSGSAPVTPVLKAGANSALTTDSVAVGDSRTQATLRVGEEYPRAGRREGRGGGELPGTIAAVRRAARDSPADASAWLELAEAWRDAARPLESRLALLQARSVASGTVRDSVDRALSEVYGTAPGLRVEALWGRTLQQGAAAGPRFAEARLRATTFLEVWGRYDRSLPREVPGLLRGPDALDAYYGGAEVEWGPDGRAATVLEAGRREVEGRELIQNVVRIEQEVRFPTDRGHVRVQGGGLVGRWYDRDDWLAYVRGAVPVALSVDIRPSVSVGETVGTDLAARGRVPAREVRGGLGVEVRPAPGLRITPAFRYGVVEADAGEGSDSLWEVELAASIPITGDTGLEIVARRQSPPRSPEFTILAAGLRFAIN